MRFNIFSTMDRYVGRRFLGIYGICLLGFVMLFIVVDGVGRLGDFVEAHERHPEGASALALGLQFYLNRIPSFSVLFAPYLTLFAAIACLMTFTRHNELAPMISAGRSLHRILLPVYLSAIVITGVLLVAEEVVVPRSIAQVEAVERRMEGEKTARGEKVPHLRDAQNTFIVERWFRDDLRLGGVRALHFADATGGLPGGVFQADALVYRRRESDGHVGWFPVGGRLTPYGKDDEGRLHEELLLPPDEPIAFDITPTQLDVLAEEKVEALSSAKLRELRALYPDKYSELSMQLYSRRTRPLANFILLLMGLPFVARPGQRSIAAGLAVAFGCCIVYMAFNLFFQEMGARGAVNPLIASWIGPVFFGAVGIARLDKVIT